MVQTVSEVAELKVRDLKREALLSEVTNRMRMMEQVIGQQKGKLQKFQEIQVKWTEAAKADEENMASLWDRGVRLEEELEAVKEENKQLKREKEMLVKLNGNKH